jgi:hypothetical protein
MQYSTPADYKGLRIRTSLAAVVRIEPTYNHYRINN